MSAKRAGFATHYLRYSTGNFLVIVAGLVSFPIFTRLLDNTQYGILNYYDSWVLMAVAFGKLGAQHSILRFYPHDGDAARLRAFSTNQFYLPLAISLSIWALVVSGMLVADLAFGLRQPGMFWLAAAAVPLMVFASLVETVLRTTENSHLVMVSRIGWRWLELATMVGAVLLVSHSASAAYAGKLAAAVLVLAFYGLWMRGNLGFSRTALDFGAFRDGFIYGLPLVANEILAIAFLLLDRIMIKGIVGSFDAVGVYSIGAALAMQVNSFTNLALLDAFSPMANRVYFSAGAARLRELKGRVLVPLTHALVGISVLLWCFGSDTVIALSGHNKSGSGPVFAAMGAAYALTSLLRVSGYGLLLDKRPYKVLALTFASLLLNSVLNLLWIPAYGVMGAVYATVVSTVFYNIATCVWLPRELLQFPPLRTLLVASGLALACLLASAALGGLAPGWPRLLIGGSAVAIFYAAAALALEPRLRTMLMELLRQRLPARLRSAN